MRRSAVRVNHVLVQVSVTIRGRADLATPCARLTWCCVDVLAMDFLAGEGVTADHSHGLPLLAIARNDGDTLALGAILAQALATVEAGERERQTDALLAMAQRFPRCITA